MLNALNDFPDPSKLRSQLMRASIPVTGAIGAALERYQLNLAKLVFAQLSAQATMKGLDIEALAVPESPTQLRSAIEADGALLTQTIADNRSGVDD